MKLFFIAFLSVCSCEKLLNFYKSECAFNPKYIGNGSCDLDLRSHKLGVTNIDFGLIIPLENVHLNWVLFRFFTQFRPYLYNESTSLCEVTDGSFTNNRKLSFLTKTIIKNSKHNMNMPSCKLNVSKLIYRFTSKRKMFSSQGTSTSGT